VNGIAVHNLKTGVRCAANELALVTFASLPSHVIDDAIVQGSIFSSAGAFAIEDPIFAPHVAAVRGSREAVQGLPLASLRRLIAQASLPPPAGTAPPRRAKGMVVRVLQPADMPSVRQVPTPFPLGSRSNPFRVHLLSRRSFVSFRPSRNPIPSAALFDWDARHDPCWAALRAASDHLHTLCRRRGAPRDGQCAWALAICKPSSRWDGGQLPDTAVLWPGACTDPSQARLGLHPEEPEDGHGMPCRSLPQPRR
jgi:hypothetical protein